MTATSGTGIVHQAPAFGEDDHRIAIKHGLIEKGEMPPCPIDERGRFTSVVPEYEGQYIKVSRFKNSHLAVLMTISHRMRTRTSPSTSRLPER